MSGKNYKCDVTFDKNGKYSRHARMKIDGFWSPDKISVRQDSGLGEFKWKPPELRYGSGGEDGTLSSLECAKSFINGLMKAISIAERWDVDTGKVAK